MEQPGRAKIILASSAIGLFALIIFGMLWFFFLAQAPVGLGWYLFSFASGLTMIVLPCTLPLAFVIVPLSMGKGPVKGLGIALSFGLGVALMLSMYGVVAAVVGQVAIGTIGAPLETVKNWLYFIAGSLAYLFALGEIGLLNFHMPTYSGAAPAFIQRRGDYFKALLLGLFLGNIGVGCPHPATPVILTRIAASGDIFYGWMLFFVHAIGRVLPLLLLAVFAILGVNALSWLVARKDKVERATGWGMVYVAGFILVLGLFTHGWWVFSGQHTLFEELTGEEQVLGSIIRHFNLGGIPHSHGIPTGTGLFGLPFWLGNWALALFWILPIWWYFWKKKKNMKTASEEEKNIETKVSPYRFWLALVLSLFIALVVIRVLPDRFLSRLEAPGVTHAKSAGAHPNGHGESILHEAAEIREGLSVDLTISPSSVMVGSTTKLDFLVNQKPGNVPVSAADLELDRTKLMHVIGVRSDMNEFFHIHPATTTRPGILSVSHIFSKPGSYKIWSEIKKDGVNHTFGHPAIEVEGAGAKFEKQVAFGYTAFVDKYLVSLQIKSPVIKSQATDLVIDVRELNGSETKLEDYLGVPMHLSIIKDDWSQFIHTHPEGQEQHAALHFVNEARAHEEETTVGVAPQGVQFHVDFPRAGLYRAFAQFRPTELNLPADEALMASFWIRVEDKAPGSNKPALIAISLVLLVILSLIVNKFLRAKVV